MDRNIKVYFLTLLVLTIFFASSTPLFAQKEALRNQFSARINAIGASADYEWNFTDNFILETEFAYRGGFYKNFWNEEVQYVFTSILSLHPKYYYNIKKRVSKGKNISNNAGNYVSLDFSYVPNLFTHATEDGTRVISSFAIIPKYSLRRSFAKKFFFEFAFGIGYQWQKKSVNGLTGDLDLQIGYAF